jgi:hypothetical protein
VGEATASGVRTGQTGRREVPRQSLRAPKIIEGKRALRQDRIGSDLQSPLEADEEMWLDTELG